MLDLLRIVDHKLPEGVGLLSPAMTTRKKPLMGLRITGEVPGKQLKLEKQLDLRDLEQQKDYKKFGAGEISMDLYICCICFNFSMFLSFNAYPEIIQPTQPVADGAVEFPRLDLVTWSFHVM